MSGKILDRIRMSSLRKDDIKNIFEKELSNALDNQEFNINEKINRLDAFFLYRILLGRNPTPEENKNICSLNITFREYLDSIVNSQEYSKSTRFMPPGHEFMSELKDFKFYFNTSDREMGVKMAIDDYENEEAALLKKFLKPGMGCIDAGAQTGFYTLHMAKIIGPSGKLYAFEPNPKTFNLLQKNIIVNDFSNIVNSYNVGLSDIEAEIEASEVSNMYISGTIEGGISRKMKLVRGDDIIKDRIDFIKIDIEGCEPSALRGMTRLINQYQPIIFSEVNEYWLRDRAKMNSQQYLEFLQSLGYRVYNIKSVINGKYDELSHLSLNILDTIDVICMPRK